VVNDIYVGMPKKLTQDEFIRRSIILYGGRYDYSLVEYRGAHTTVKIICKAHGEFLQEPNTHLKGSGCNKCNRIVQPLTTETFIEKAIKKHGNIDFDYSLVEYKVFHEKIKIICNVGKHIINIEPKIFLSHKHGCNICHKTFTNPNSIRVSDLFSFIRKSKNIHGDKYDYSLVEYISSRENINIICLIHGLFKQTPQSHSKGFGCKKCGAEIKANKKRLTTTLFIDKANTIHRFKYDYSLVNYIDNKKEVIIICNNHGPFNQIAAGHLNGNGCPKCAHSVSKPEIEWLNYLNIPNDNQHRQVRINTSPRKLRVDGFDPKTNTVYQFHGDYWHSNPDIYQADKNHPDINKSHGEVYKDTSLKDQRIRDAGYNLVVMWENNFKKILKEQRKSATSIKK
jgi:hypothetical protein